MPEKCSAAPEALQSIALAVKPKIDIETLPPLPAPVRQVQRREEALSIIVVCGSSAVLLTLTLLLAYRVDNVPTAYSLTVVVIVSGSVMVALAGLVGLLWGDPGVVHRSQQTCFPIPSAVLEALEGEGTSGMENVSSEDGLQSYCVRCLVWRPKLAAHHCSICQRCVLQFDHHCSFYGRCITDKNVRCFHPVPLAGFVGALACFSFCAVCAFVEAAKSWSDVALGCVFGGIAIALVGAFYLGGGPLAACNPVTSIRKMINLACQ